MGELIKFDGSIPQRFSSGGGGGMEARIARLESDVGEIKVDVAVIKTQIESRFPDFATKADIADIKTETIDTKGSLSTSIADTNGSLSTSISDLKGSLSTKIADTKASLIQWMVGTMIACAGLAACIAFGLAKLIQ